MEKKTESVDSVFLCILFPVLPEITIFNGCKMVAFVV